MKFTLMLFVMFAVFACKKKEIASDNKNEQSENSTNSTTVNSSGDTTKSDPIIDDLLITKTYSDWTVKKIRAIYNPTNVNTSIRQNLYDSQKKDTLLSFFSAGDSINLYISPAKSFPSRLVVTSNKLAVENYIEVGMDKKSFYKNFNTKQFGDTVMVEDVAGFTNFTLYFANEKLTRFIYRVKRIE